MVKCKAFISYSHQDEWLKDEFIKHLSALKRNGLIDVWHDRRIPAGGILKEEIDKNLEDSNLILLLISNDFIASDYCFEKEYAAAEVKFKAGNAIIVPIIVRDCDWDVGNLKGFNALPPDAIPVTQKATSRSDAQDRDPAWMKVIAGLKPLIETLKKSLEPPTLKKEYNDKLFQVDFVRHPSLDKFDENKIFVDPDVYFEDEKEQITSIKALYEAVSNKNAVILTGTDRSGKTLIAKKIQHAGCANHQPWILINGKNIRNRDVMRVLKAAKFEQFGETSYVDAKFRIIIDDSMSAISPIK